MVGLDGRYIQLALENESERVILTRLTVLFVVRGEENRVDIAAEGENRAVTASYSI